MHMDVEDALHDPKAKQEEETGGPVIGKSAEASQVPKWVYTKMNKDTQGFYLDDITAFFEEKGCQRDSGGSAHVMNCPNVPEPLELHASLTQKDPVKAPRVNQVEFVMRVKVREGGKDRGSSVRWWYWINVNADNTAVRLQFDGNVGGDPSKLGKEKMDEQRKRQAQSDENETAYVRYLKDTDFDASAQITFMVRQLEQYLSAALSKRVPVAVPSGKGGSKEGGAKKRL